MIIKYLYLDDEEIDLLEPFTDAVMGEGDELYLDIKHPVSYGLDMDRLINALQEYDGLILDWRLDQVANSKSKTSFPFRAAALAQEIRTRETEDTVKALPIVLWSIQERLTGSFYEDDTSHDLFDTRYDKTYIGENPAAVRAELLSLVLGYAKIIEFLKSQQKNSLEYLLSTQQEFLDVRLVKQLGTTKPPHEYARFVINDLLERPGVLLNEEFLAARLGVDIKASLDWTRLLEYLPAKCKYQGPFHEAWSRWWAYCVEQDWWRSLKDSQPPLSRLNAKKRIAILKESTGLENIFPAQPIEPHYRSKFSTVCEYHHRSLDPLDGVIIDEDEPEPWQERRYISLDVALERRGEDKGLYPHPTEQERLKNIRNKRNRQ